MKFIFLPFVKKVQKSEERSLKLLLKMLPSSYALGFARAGSTWGDVQGRQLRHSPLMGPEWALEVPEQSSGLAVRKYSSNPGLNACDLFTSEQVIFIASVFPPGKWE